MLFNLKNQDLIKTISGALIFFVIFFCFYEARQAKIKQMNIRLIQFKNQIRELSAMSKNKTAEQIRTAMKLRYETINNKFRAKEEDAFKVFATTARNSRVEIISFRPGTKSEYVFKDKEKVRVDGKQCYKIPISMSLKGSYKNCIQYVQGLEDTIPLTVTIERLNIAKSSAADFGLNITLEITVYLLS